MVPGQKLMSLQNKNSGEIPTMWIENWSFTCPEKFDKCWDPINIIWSFTDKDFGSGNIWKYFADINISRIEQKSWNHESFCLRHCTSLIKYIQIF